MIRKLILIFMALSFFSVCFAGSIQDMHKAVIARKNATVVTCTTQVSQLEDNTSNGLYAGDTNWQEIKAQGVEITICQIDILAYYTGAAADLHVEVWNTARDTQYGDDSSIVSIDTADAGGAVYSFTWSGTEPVVPNADFVILFVKDDANGSRLLGHGDETKYEDTNYDLFINSTDIDEDAYFNIYVR